MKKVGLSVLILILFLFGCRNQGKVVADWPNAVTYEIFVQSFYDSDGDGIGDINGMTQKLDYLEDLGIQAVWLMPIMPSPTYHKYDVTDYRDIHPDYGTMEDFKNFVDEAHQRNIHVVIDLVINHTSNQHPWFQASMKGQNAYRDFYVWEKEDKVSDLDTVKTGPDSDNPYHWHPVEGDDEMYYGFFWGGMPDLNFNNPEVKEEIYEIARYWLEDLNVDGFRLDAARHIFDENAEDNHAFWVEFKEEMQKIKPDVYLVGEVWSDMKSVAPYLKGIPALFNFDMGTKILEVVNEQNESGLPGFHQHILNYYDSVNNNFVDATFITNHDQNRVMSEVDGDVNKAKMAASLLFSLPGAPYIYYGEEIGMLGKKPDEQIREPFIWDTGQNDSGQPSWQEAVYSTSETVTPLKLQKEDPGSIYNHYRSWIHYRNQSEILTYGSIIPTDIKVDGIASYYRFQDQDTLLVIHNLKDQVMEVNDPVFKRFNKTANTFNGDINLQEEGAEVSPYTSVILKN